jgi:hypothetical protein
VRRDDYTHSLVFSFDELLWQRVRFAFTVTYQYLFPHLTVDGALARATAHAGATVS